MFFHEDLIINKRYKNVWRAAHNQETDTDDVKIPKVCNSVGKMMDDYSDYKLRHLSFRTAYTLFLGTVKTYKEQLDKLSKDAFNMALEMEIGTSNIGAIDEDISNHFQTDGSSNGDGEENFDPGNKATSINNSDTNETEVEMNGNTRAADEEHSNPGDKEQSVNNGNDTEVELNGNTRAEARSPAESRISDVTRQLSPVIGTARTTVVNPTAKDRSPIKRKSDDKECQESNSLKIYDEGTSTIGVDTRTHRSKVLKRSQEVQTIKSFIKNQKLKELYRRKDPVFDNDLPLAHITIYAAGSRRPVKTIWSNVNPDVMKL